MMSSIEHFAPRPSISLNTHRTAEKTQNPQATAHGHSAPNYFKSVQMADDLSAAMAQFRRRSDIEKRSPNSADPFERILENDAEPKVEKLLVIAHTSNLNPKQFLIEARAMFPDDSDLVLVLREIIRRRKLRNENTSVLEEVMEQVWAESNEKHCKAGMNVGFKAQLFAKQMAVTPWALRETYRHFLTSDERELTQYEQWVGQYGSTRRYLVAEFIETALIHDIQSHDPSCSREEFGWLLNHVVNFKKLLSCDKAFLHVFLKREQRKGGQGRQQKKDQEKKEDQQEIDLEVDILSCWFDCLRRPFKIKKEIEKNDFAQLMANTKLSKPELQQKLLRAIQLLDGDLFFDPEAKDILLQVILRKVDPGYPPAYA